MADQPYTTPMIEDPTDPNEGLGVLMADPAVRARAQQRALLAAIQQSLASPEQALASHKRVQGYQKDQGLGILGMLSGDPVLGGVGKQLSTGAHAGLREEAMYGPDARLLKLAQGMGREGAKVDTSVLGNETKIITGAGRNATQTGIAGGHDKTAVTVGGGHDAAKIEAAKIAAQGGIDKAGISAGSKGGAKPLAASELASINNFDAAKNRLDTLDKLFDQGVGTYPGANTIHDIANVFGAQDPRFDVIRSLSKSHLFKGLKSDIGGRITNFEIKYGTNMFPTETDRISVAKAKIALLREILAADKEETIANFGRANRDVAGFTGEAPKAPAKKAKTLPKAGAPAPAAAPAVNPDDPLGILGGH